MIWRGQYGGHSGVVQSVGVGTVNVMLDNGMSVSVAESFCCLIAESNNWESLATTQHLNRDDRVVIWQGRHCGQSGDVQSSIGSKVKVVLENGTAVSVFASLVV